MKKLMLLSLFTILAACSSSSVKDSKTDSDDVTVGDAPAVNTSQELKAVSIPDEPVRPVIQTAPSQYAALNEAIKAQSDDRIYQTATQILTQAPNDVKALNALAMYHYKKGRFDLCRYLLGKAITASPRTAELYSNLGVVQLAQNERRDAVKSFRKALDVNSNEAVAASNLGAIYVQEKDYTKAGVVLETAYKRGVRDVRVLNNYAIVLTAQKKFDRAEDIYKTVLKDDSNSKDALYNYAILLVDNMGKFPEGLEIINRLKFVGGPSETRNRIIALENKAKAGLK